MSKYSIIFRLNKFIKEDWFCCYNLTIELDNVEFIVVIVFFQLRGLDWLYNHRLYVAIHTELHSLIWGCLLSCMYYSWTKSVSIAFHVCMPILSEVFLLLFVFNHAKTKLIAVFTLGFWYLQRIISLINLII